VQLRPFIFLRLSFGYSKGLSDPVVGLSMGQTAEKPRL